jgi:peptidoglycan/LPS O-acetylase OafA/YrhL
MGHVRGLDGIRALSVLAFHTGLNSVPGGFYGVDFFFVLSGFLITSLLVRQRSGSGTIRLRRFWAGRARRLLRALSSSSPSCSTCRTGTPSTGA